MDRDEKARLVALGEGRPLVERNECVVVACHHYLVAAGLFELMPQDECECQHDVFFNRAQFHGARIHAAVTWVEHDDGSESPCGALLGTFGKARQWRLHSPGAEGERTDGKILLSRIIEPGVRRPDDKR